MNKQSITKVVFSRTLKSIISRNKCVAHPVTARAIVATTQDPAKPENNSGEHGQEHVSA